MNLYLLEPIQEGYQMMVIEGELVKLWVSYPDNMGYKGHGYDTYDSAVVAAASEEEAKNINPNTYSDKLEIWNSMWPGDTDYIKAYLIGTAAEGIRKGVIVASFNAG